jgi:hypothetical protein
MTDRSAIDTIRGYFYQFDYSILEILNLSNKNDSAVIEGIEDIDIKSHTQETAVQCKYYAKTDYNHSVIAKPIRLMLSHFSHLKKNNSTLLRYKLRGFYKSGHDKLSLPLSLDDFKKNFLVYKKDKVRFDHQKDLNLNDNEIVEFMGILDIEHRAKSFEIQYKELIDKLKSIFSCSEFVAEYYYYNNALREIKELATKEPKSARSISQKEFIEKINNSRVLFNEWFIQFKGVDKFFKRLRKEYFSTLNISPFDRFFLIQIDENLYSRQETKDQLLSISKKWSRTTKRDPKSFCPYFYIHDISSKELIEIKKELVRENYRVIDGFDFSGADFNPNSLLREPPRGKGLNIKIVNDLSYLIEALKTTNRTKKVYQFYLDSVFFNIIDDSIDVVSIQVEKIKDIKSIV